MAEIDLSYAPRGGFLPFHQREQRWACMVAHRRCGKTVACINELIERASYTSKKMARYGYLAPFYSQAKEVAWEYLKEYGGNMSLKPRESELSIQLKHNKAKIQLYGADNPDKFRGMYFDGVILDEYGDMKPSVWTKNVLPTLADRRGWAVFIGTPKGKNHFYKIFKRSQEEANWFNLVLKASQTGYLSEEELTMQRAEMSADEFEQEYECSFEAAVMGTYYAKLIAVLEDRRQIRSDVTWDPDQPVQAALDLGYTDSTAIWFWQERPDGLAIIDYEEAHSQALPYYFELLANKGYRYSTIWLPHDAKAKSLQTGRSTVEQFLSYPFPEWEKNSSIVVRIAPQLSLQHGIDAARLILPSCHFSLEKTQDGVEGLRAYRRKWDEEKKSYSDTPLHDWSSHPSDAFRYLALVAKEKVMKVQTVQAQVNRRIVEAPKITLDGLWEERESGYRNRWIKRI